MTLNHRFIRTGASRKVNAADWDEELVWHNAGGIPAGVANGDLWVCDLPEYTPDANSVALYHLHNSVYTDASGNGKTPTPTGGPTFGPDGLVCTATPAYAANTAIDLSGATVALTLESWVRWTGALPANGTTRWFTVWYKSGTDYIYIRLVGNVAAPPSLLAVFLLGGGTYTSVGTVLSAPQWAALQADLCHVALVVTMGTPGSGKLYLNGVQVGATATPANVPTPTAGNGGLYIGGNSAAISLEGIIDSVHLSKTNRYPTGPALSRHGLPRLRLRTGGVNYEVPTLGTSDLRVNRLILGGGLATAGAAQLKLLPGTLLATPEAGALEYVGGKLYWTSVATQRALDRSNGAVLADVTVTDTIAETTVYTSVIAANALRVGNLLKTYVSGVITNASAADDITINVYIGTTLLHTFKPAIGNVVGAVWHVDNTITIRTIGAGGTLAFHGDIDMATFQNHASMVNGFNSTTANNITIKVQWDAAKAGNIMTLRQGLTEYKN